VGHLSLSQFILLNFLPSLSLSEGGKWRREEEEKKKLNERCLHLKQRFLFSLRRRKKVKRKR